MGQLNAGQHGCCRGENFEIHHQSDNSLDGPMILLYAVVQISVLTNFKRLQVGDVALMVEPIQRRFLGC